MVWTMSGRGGGACITEVMHVRRGGGAGMEPWLTPATSCNRLPACLQLIRRCGLIAGQVVVCGRKRWQRPAGASAAPQPAPVPLAMLLVVPGEIQWLLLYHGLQQATNPSTRPRNLCVVYLCITACFCPCFSCPLHTCRYGMWRFVREMVTVAGDWVAERRSRVGPDDPDPEAFSRRSADPSLLRPHHALVSPGPVTPGDTGDTNGSPARRPLLLSVPTAPADLSAMGGADALSSSSSAGSGLSGVTSVTSSGASSVLSLSEYYGTAGMAPLEQGLGGGVGRIAAAIQKQQAAAAAGAGAAGGATSAHQQQHHQRHQGGGRGDAPRSNIVRSHSLTWEPTDETYSSIIRAHAIAFTPRASQQPMRQAPPFSANTHQQWGQVPVSPFAAVAGGSGGVAGSPFAWDHGAADAPTVSSSSGGSAHGRPAAGAAGEPVQDKAYTKMQGSTATSSSTDRATKRPASAAATTPAGLAARLLAPVQHAAAGVQQAAGSVRSGVADLLRAGSAAAAAAARHQDYGVGHQQQQKQQQRRQPSATHPLPPSAAPPPAAYGEQKGTQAAPAGPLRLSGAVAAVHRTTSQHLLRTGSNSTAAAGTPSASAASSKAPSVTGDGHADGASSSSSNPAAAATTAGGAGKAMLPPAGVGRVRGVTWAPAGALDDSAAGSSVTSSRRSSIEALGDVGDHATHRAGHQVAPGGTRKRQTLAQRKADQQAAAAAAGGASAGSSSTSKGRWAKVLLRKAAAAALVVVGGRLLQREVAEGWRSRQQQRRQQQQGPSSVHPVGSSGGGSGAGKLQPKAGGRNGSSEAWVWRAGDQVWLAAVQDKLL
jgi:hypothetical protein